MEKLINCNIIVHIEYIELISGSNQFFEVLFLSKSKEKFKIVFDSVWDLRCSIENGYIDRFSKFIRNTEQESSILLIENSENLKYFENQISGTLPMDNIKNYILFDAVDTIVEVLTIKEPTLIRML